MSSNDMADEPAPSLSAPTFTQRKYAWLDQVADDERLSPFAFKVAYVIATRFLNSRNGQAWPTQETLGRIMGATPRGVRKAINQLEGTGHLASRRQPRRGAPNSYSIVHIEVDYRNDGSSNEKAHYGNRGSSNRPITGTVVPPIPEPRFLQNPMNEPIEKEVQKNTRPIGALTVVSNRSDEASEKRPSAAVVEHGFVDDFEAWWPIYPRHVSKGAARKAYLSVRKAKKATAEELKAGAIRYAAAMTGREAQYIKHGATWLNAECWGDEPEQQARPLVTTPQHATGMPSALAGIMKAGGLCND